SPPFGIAQQPSEAQQVDVLNLYDDGSQQDQTGTLSQISLTGFGMGTGLTFAHPAFGEPATLPGGIQFGQDACPAGSAYAANTCTTIEILNLMLGQGNDNLTITGTLQASLDQPADDKLPTAIPSLFGTMELVQGGGN